jgi:hypothetical protein
MALRSSTGASMLSLQPGDCRVAVFSCIPKLLGYGRTQTRYHRELESSTPFH